MRILWALALVVGLCFPASALEEVWVSGCEGQADVAGTITPEQAKHQALSMARSQALQKVSGLRVTDQFVQVMTERGREGSDFAFKEMTAVTEGIILEERHLQWSDERIVLRHGEPPLQRLHLRGDFKVAKLPPSDPDFDVSLKLNRTTLVAGDVLNLIISASQPARLMVFNLAADDRVYMVYPNRFVSELTVSRNRSVTVPAPNDGFELRPRPLDGHAMDTEAVRVIATRVAVQPPKADEDGRLSLSAFYRWLYSLPAAKWVQADQVYTIHADTPAGSQR